MGKLEKLQLFVRIVDAGGIGRAALQMNLAKSAVSRRLNELEEELGVQLIQRTTRRLHLTDAGENYYQDALKLLELSLQMDAQLSDANQQHSGTLRLALPYSFGLIHLTPAIEQFCREHPQINVDIDFSDQRIDLIEKGIDLSIRIGELKDSSLQAKKICPISTLLCASPIYLKKTAIPKDLDQLITHPFLLYSGSPLQLRLQDPKGIWQTIAPKRRITANNGEFLRDMAIAGHGILHTPLFISWQALCTGELIPVLPDYRSKTLNAYALYPKNRYLPQRARLFIDFLSERFGNTPYWEQFPLIHDSTSD